MGNMHLYMHEWFCVKTSKVGIFILNENVNGDNTYEQQRRARADSILLMADIKISQIYIT